MLRALMPSQHTTTLATPGWIGKKSCHRQPVCAWHALLILYNCCCMHAYNTHWLPLHLAPPAVNECTGEDTSCFFKLNSTDSGRMAHTQTLNSVYPCIDYSVCSSALHSEAAHPVVTKNSCDKLHTHC